MTLLKSTIASLALIFASATGSAQANTYHHIDQLALKIERESKQLVYETRLYVHTPEYGHLVSDSREMATLAHHLHDVAHSEGESFHLESDLAQLDAKFHHLESLVDAIEHRAAYGDGHIHGGTSHVKRLLNSIEDSIHHLQDDLRSLRTASHRAPVVVRRPVYAPSYYRQSPHAVPAPVVVPSHRGHSDHGHSPGRRTTRTISLGNGRFSFSF
ncbi:hypothetical protein [Rubripirellula reticaptiva]|uniref:Uncharacterized protein n=1 Tax=Rubripirellula reticaptiva TaxID=2528013 RepID=A0A5C6EQ73_9BACT|nr:hypothetical protein [Rubripirellula reticaptiva]TWU51923.1 hypothetical protein Poly59_35190 [Rubripirellula reticaptiva]